MDACCFLVENCTHCPENSYPANLRRLFKKGKIIPKKKVLFFRGLTSSTMCWVQKQKKWLQLKKLRNSLWFWVLIFCFYLNLFLMIEVKFPVHFKRYQSPNTKDFSFFLSRRNFWRCPPLSPKSFHFRVNVTFSERYFLLRN